ncbi:hypothetical protein CYMTET_21837 [Cymbomonas tetramitiformis]|uniref:Uncharacterized protein n=1 Tax=Cymbomonas tetramitiformis TaxID=36881 RepID=A0AAE0G1D3_9CHLO|nr:hypothetical protein CYMTET_21837 [Cymbomonas tetramitiformis]
MVDPMSPAADWMDSSHSSFPADGKRVLLEFARRMIPAGDPFQGQADMLGLRISAGVDPHDKIGDFNAALKAARTRATLLDEDVKALFIKALDTNFYQPVVSRLLLHDQRAAHDLLTIQHDGCVNATPSTCGRAPPRRPRTGTLTVRISWRGPAMAPVRPMSLRI